MKNEDIHFDLVMDEDLAENKYPKKFNEARQANEKAL